MALPEKAEALKHNGRIINSRRGVWKEHWINSPCQRLTLPASVDLASLISYSCTSVLSAPVFQKNLIDAGPSARAYYRPKLILTRLRPRDFSTEETIVGKVQRKFGLGPPRLSVLLQCNTDYECDLEGWGGRISPTRGFNITAYLARLRRKTVARKLVEGHTPANASCVHVRSLN